MDVRLPKVGDKVNIIEKRNYENGTLTTGVVRRLLSNPNEVHPRGNKVELENGTVGRTVSFVDEVGPQSFVDPADRQKYTDEIRKSMPQKKVLGGNRTAPGKRFFEKRDFNNNSRGGSFHNEPAEPPVNLADIPGEDDLR